MAESIQEDLEEYKASEGEVKRLKESMVEKFLDMEITCFFISLLLNDRVWMETVMQQ